MNGKRFRSTWPVFDFSVVFPHPSRLRRATFPVGEGFLPAGDPLFRATLSQERVTIHKFPGKFRLFLCPSGVEKGLTVRGGYDIVIIQKNILPPSGEKIR